MKKIIRPILEKMCTYVGARYEDVDFYNQQDPFYMKYEWSEEQQKDFVEWLTNYLLENKNARNRIMKFPTKDKKILKVFVEFFANNYGWKSTTSE